MNTNESPKPLSAALAQYAERWKAPEFAPPATVESLPSWIASANAVRVLRDVPKADPKRCPTGLLEAIRAAHKAKAWPIYLTGKTGTGKSSAAAYCFRAALARSANEARNDQQWPRWVVWPEFCAGLIAARIDGITIINETGSPYTADEAAWWRRWATRRLVVVDELGLRTANEVRQEAMWKLLEVRRELPTILTGNLDGGAIQNTFDDRILSRLLAGTWINVGGDDQRVIGAEHRIINIG